MGRKTKFTEGLAEEILDRLESGETLVSICKSRKMPALRTVRNWIDNVPGSGRLKYDFSEELEEELEPFRRRYLRAQEIGLETRLDIHFDDSRDRNRIMVEDENGFKKPSQVVLNQDKHAFEITRLQLEARHAHYQKKSQLELKGKVETEKKVPRKFTAKDYAAMPPEAREAADAFTEALIKHEEEQEHDDT